MAVTGQGLVDPAEDKQSVPPGRDDLVDKFLAAATDLLTRNPPSAITGRQLAKAAGLNYGLLHRHVGTKKDALYLALNRINESFITEVFDPETNLPGPNPLPAQETFWRANAYVLLDEVSFRDYHLHSPVIALYRNGLTAARPDLAKRDIALLVTLSSALQLGMSSLYRQGLAPGLGLDPDDSRIDDLMVTWVDGIHRGTGPLGTVPPTPRRLRGAPYYTAPASSLLDGRRSAERQLIEAGAALLSDRAPSAISGRDLAEVAGVNYGLIHHYFRSKDEVLRQALRWHRHNFHLATNRDGRGADYFELSNFPGFVRALTWAAIDRQVDIPGPTDTERPSIDILLSGVAERYGTLTTDRRIALLASVSVQLAWVLIAESVELELGYSIEPFVPYAAALLHRLITES